MHVTCRYLRSKLCTSKCRLINNSMKMKNYDRGEAYLPRKKTSASRQRTKLSEDRDRDSVITAINHCDESLLVILPAVPTDLTTSTDNTAIVWQIAFQQRRFVVFLFVKRLVGCKVTVYYTVYVHGTCLLAETPAISSEKKIPIVRVRAVRGSTVFVARLLYLAASLTRFQRVYFAKALFSRWSDGEIQTGGL